MIFEAHPFKGEVCQLIPEGNVQDFSIWIFSLVFTQGDEGKSWYIILKGSVQCVVYGKGIVGIFHEGDDFGKLSLVNNSPR